MFSIMHNNIQKNTFDLYLSWKIRHLKLYTSQTKFYSCSYNFPERTNYALLEKKHIHPSLKEHNLA